jgi:ubiquinone/menaquinone biosynthesis C-methylase UbiE
MYFDIVKPEMFTRDARIIDIGCGSGRFIKYIRERYEHQLIVGIDPSSAILAADSLLGTDDKVILVQAAADNIPYPENYFDFAYSLGVLHHIPDTQKALNDSVKILKPGGYFLLYLYYNLDNRNFFFKAIFHLSNLVRALYQNARKSKKDYLRCPCNFTIYALCANVSPIKAAWCAGNSTKIYTATGI